MGVYPLIRPEKAQRGGGFSPLDVSLRPPYGGYMYKQIAAVVIAVAMIATGCVFISSDSTEAVEMNDTTYETLTAAIDAAPIDGTQVTISLTGNTTESITILSGKNIVLDLGIYTLTNTPGHHTISVQEGATLIIEGTGTIDNTSHARASIYNGYDDGPGGSVTINGGTITRSQENGSSSSNGGNSYYNILNSGVMIINDGASVIQDGHYSSMICNSGSGTITDFERAYLTINGGYFSGGLNTIKNDGACELIIYDGTFENNSQASVLSYEPTTIYGGTFTVTDDAVAVILNGCDDSPVSRGTLTIYGGTFNGPVGIQEMNPAGYEGQYNMGTIEVSGGIFNITGSVFNVINDPSPSITVYGGTYSSDVRGYVADGYQQVGSIVGPISTETPITPSNPDVVVDSETDTVIIPVEKEVSNATVSATVVVSDRSKVSMVYQGSLTTDGLAMSASQVTVENLPNVIRENLLTVYELNVIRGTNTERFDLTVTIDVDIPDGTILSNAWVVYYDDKGETEYYQATVDGSSVTFTTNHTSTYAFYGELVEEQTPLPPVWDDDDDYVPPVYVPEQDSGSDDTVIIVACAAAAVVAAIMAVFLIVERKR